jgi:uncharacterized membrane protein
VSPTVSLSPTVSATGRTARQLATYGLAAFLFALAFARLATFHHRTFDLAFYTRMAWGLARGDLWDPFLEAHVLGLHVSPVLAPIGVAGLLVGTAPALLLAQSVACALTAKTLGLLAVRRLGAPYFWLGFFAFALHPNLVHVATYEAHPGTLALLPLALAAERLDARDRRGFVLAVVGVLLCREDLALVTALLGAIAHRTFGLRTSLPIALGSLAYLGLFVGYLHPRFSPETGSFALHFGVFGDTPGAVISRWISEPSVLFSHLFDGKRGTYLARILLPLALVPPLLGARFLVPALPIVAINLVSAFPTTPNLDSHYLSPALPFVVVATIVGVAKLRADKRRGAALAIVACSAIFYGALGRHPNDPAFAADPRTDAARTVLAAIPADVSVQAPDPLLPHLAERARVHRAPPPDRDAEVVVLDLAHRDRYAQREDLLRTIEEPRVRDWLARADYGPLAHAAPYLVLRRGADPRRFLERFEPTRASIEDHAEPDEDEPDEDEPTEPNEPTEPRDDSRDSVELVRLTPCLGIVGAWLVPDGVALELLAHGPCPSDLALRVGPGELSRRVDLIADGLVSPAHLRAGDRFVSRHRFRPGLLDAEVWLGALRSSGARPEPGDPIRVRVPLRGGPTR